jgi:hypothetical protein
MQGGALKLKLAKVANPAENVMQISGGESCMSKPNTFWLSIMVHIIYISGSKRLLIGCRNEFCFSGG